MVHAPASVATPPVALSTPFPSAIHPESQPAVQAPPDPREALVVGLDTRARTDGPSSNAVAGGLGRAVNGGAGMNASVREHSPPIWNVNSLLPGNPDIHIRTPAHPTVAYATGVGGQPQANAGNAGCGAGASGNAVRGRGTGVIGNAGGGTGERGNAARGRGARRRGGRASAGRGTGVGSNEYSANGQGAHGVTGNGGRGSGVNANGGSGNGPSRPRLPFARPRHFVAAPPLLRAAPPLRRGPPAALPAAVPPPYLRPTRRPYQPVAALRGVTYRPYDAPPSAAAPSPPVPACRRPSRPVAARAVPAPGPDATCGPALLRPRPRPGHALSPAAAHRGHVHRPPPLFPSPLPLGGRV
ncbi:unnamed protein product [Closterium sp. NIES-64]|nr:unnamed protein product [Closterium sp. NIES-64]